MPNSCDGSVFIIKASPLAVHVYAIDPEIVSCLLRLVTSSCHEICLFSYPGKTVVYLPFTFYLDETGGTFSSVTFGYFLFVNIYYLKLPGLIGRAPQMTSPSAHVQYICL